MSKESEALPAPEGTLPFLLTMKQMDKLGLKTGARLSDVVPYAWIPMQQIQEDLSFAGSLSPWAPVQKELQVRAAAAALRAAAATGAGAVVQPGTPSHPPSTAEVPWRGSAARV